VEFIHLAMVTDKLHYLVNKVMNLWVPKHMGKYSTTGKCISFRKTLIQGVGLLN
jgi:hypothetical protein